MEAADAVLPILVHVQANLDADLALGTLAARAGYSPFHFHRAFEDEVGETLKAHVLRLRLERAAFRLGFHAGPIVAIALDCGFGGHETFTRAFRRHFGVTPSAYRRGERSGSDPAAGPGIMRTPGVSSLSTTRLASLPATHVAFIRHVGPYEKVDPALWTTLRDWSAGRALTAPPVMLGIGHDSPATTPPHRLRFDAAIAVPGPFPAEGAIGHQVLPACLYALTSHAGSYDELASAYATIFARLFARDDLMIVGLPVIEVYHTTRIDPGRAMNHTDIYIPVLRKEG
ncbi:MAG: GyrI-like domain-containing protein [Bauldia sp.]